MRVRKLVLHVGMHKTGSSSIQATLAAHRGLLADYGIHYFGLRENHSGPIYTRFADDPAGYRGNRLYGLDRPVPLAIYRAVIEASLRVAVLRARGRVLVISGEDIGLMSDAAVARLQRWFAPRVETVQVIGFVRPPMSYANSATQELLRAGHSLDQLERRAPVPAYRRRFDKFIQLFGADCLRLRLWTPGGFAEGGPVEAFLAELGLPSELRGRIAPVRRNAALSRPAAQLIDCANTILPAFRGGRPNPGRAFGLAAELGRIPGPPFQLASSALDRVPRRVADDVAWMEGLLGRRLADVDITPAAREEVGDTRAPGDRPTGPARIRTLNALLKRRERWQPRLLARRLVLRASALTWRSDDSTGQAG